MIRRLLLATALVLAACSGMAAAEPFHLTHAFSVVRPKERPQEPTIRGRVEGTGAGFYGGVQGRTLATANQSASFSLFVGVRPQVGPVEVDLGYSRQISDTGARCCGTVALRLGREFGGRARLGARLQMDPERETATAEASASVEVFAATRIGGALARQFVVAAPAEDEHVTFNIGAFRPIGKGASMDLRYRDVAFRAGRTELSLRVQF